MPFRTRAKAHDYVPDVTVLLLPLQCGTRKLQEFSRVHKTERLYYDDPYLLEFDAGVLDRISLQDRFGILLDRTAFYPTSGGQPNDFGTLNGIPVVDVYEDEASGAVVHVVQQAVSDPAVHGIVDAERRRDHMQQHSGQHVLSQAFVELFNWPTVSFHLGASATQSTFLSSRHPRSGSAR